MRSIALALFTAILLTAGCSGAKDETPAATLSLPESKGLTGVEVPGLGSGKIDVER